MIKAIVQTDEGAYVVQCELNSEQHQFILDVGLRTLLQMGAIPVVARSEDGLDLDEDSSDIIKPAEPSKLN